MHNDIMLKVSENTIIPKPLIASKIPRYCVFFLKYFAFGFLTVTETTLVIIIIIVVVVIIIIIIIVIS